MSVRTAMMDWKEKLAAAFPEALKAAETGSLAEPAAPCASRQSLRITLDRRNRRGKQVTVVADFKGNDEDLERLCRELKTRIGTGGSVKDGEVIVQGDFRQKVCGILVEMGYKARVI